MRLKALLASAAVAATILPVTGARANHCPPDNKIVINSYVVVGVNPGAIGCAVAPTSEQAPPGGANTDYIIPRTSFVSVRYEGAAQPINTFSVIAFTGIAPVTPGCVARTCPLMFNYIPGANAWDTEKLVVDAATTLTGGTATARLCFQVENGACTVSQSHTYRTVG